MANWRVECGDCLDAMRGMDAGCVHSIVTDPPYGLSFMGKDWDHGVPGVPFWSEALRVAKPGAFLLAFGGTRTHHRLMCAIEDAGWEIRDVLSWMYGQGFPKVGYIDKERFPGIAGSLKPAWEPIVMARKPLNGTVAANVLEHGCGGINVDGCRIGTERRFNAAAGNDGRSAASVAPVNVTSYVGTECQGRWPANVVILDEEAAAMLGETARFFYCPKASTAERNAGLPPGTKNTHPTVKPVALMRWCVRLVTPPSGIVLDPFMGSGTTGVAALREGASFIGIEKDHEHAATARARIEAAHESQAA